MFNNLLKIISLFFITVLVLTGCSENSEKQLTLECGHGMDKKHPVSIAIRFFSVQVYEKSKGRILINVFPNESLGAEDELIEKTINGKIDLIKVSAAAMSSHASEYSVLGLPYLYENDLQFKNVITGKIGKSILNSGKIIGLKGLVFFNAGTRNFYSKSKFIKTPEDLKGMRIRVQPNNEAIKLLKTLGAIPVPLPYGKVFEAFEAGEIDGADNNIPSFYSSRNFDICKYYSYDGHTKIPDVFLISTKTWNKLSKADRKILQEAAEKASYIQYSLWERDVKNAIETMKLNGVKFSKADKKAFKNKVKPLYDDLTPENKEIVKRIKETES